MPTHVRIITPIVSEGVRTLEDIHALEGPDLKVTHALIETGPASIESEYDEALSVPGMLARAIEAQRDGVDAVVIDCMGDPGLKAARAVLSIPVLGPAETSMHAAAMLGRSFSIVTVLESVRPMLDNLAKVYGVHEKLASIRVVNVPVLHIGHDLGRLQSGLAEQARLAVEQDGADAIVLGCTGFFGCSQAIASTLAGHGLAVPVVDPIPITVFTAAALVRAGLSQSKRTYAFPPQKPVKGYVLPGFAR
jgi:allantoin racemase